MKNTAAGRLVLLACAGFALVLGLRAALGLAGIIAVQPLDHGALMVFGFLGTAISLERAVAARVTWGWIAPIAAAVASVTLAAQLAIVAGICWVLSFSALVGIYIHIQRRAATIAVQVQMIGAVAGVLAVAQWMLNTSFASALPMAACFAIATIIGERIELARVSFAGANAEGRIAWSVMALFSAAVVAIAHPAGNALFGLALGGVGAAALRVDVARKLIRSQGVSRYMAACMLAAYVWLILAALVWVIGGSYDVRVHAIFLGFVMSMIFAHAPTIATAVSKRTLPYHRVLYIPVILLHVGLSARVLGSLIGDLLAWRIAGVSNVVAVAVFMICAVTLSVWKGKRSAIANTRR
ncbi:hypothetical protein [Corynebacterium gerontici]|uniref:hypothetical protein n=1 Tax=Corynebacterium gerontici TaxID=2079234 RepID=UPI000F4D5E18|nr:hypothetical protein [Corynebacterium gerontici]